MWSVWNSSNDIQYKRCLDQEIRVIFNKENHIYSGCMQHIFQLVCRIYLMIYYGRCDLITFATPNRSAQILILVKEMKNNGSSSDQVMNEKWRKKNIDGKNDSNIVYNNMKRKKKNNQQMHLMINQLQQTIT